MSATQKVYLKKPIGKTKQTLNLRHKHTNKELLLVSCSNVWKRKADGDVNLKKKLTVTPVI